MSVKEVLIDRSVSSAPSAAYLAAYFSVPSIPTIVSIMTGVLVAIQAYKALLEIRTIKRGACESKE